MKITLVQQNIVWGDRKENLRRLDTLLESIPENGTELVILPEMFTTGFATTPDSRIDEEPEKTLSWMKEMSSRKNAALAGSVAMDCGNGKLVNRLYFIKPDGETAFYDKHHLFTNGGENERFTPGKERVIVEWKGLRILLLVCYDLRFPVWIRNRGDYDGIICVANWPTARQDAWNTLSKARAIENLSFVVAVNRVGVDPVCQYLGGSVLYDSMGTAVCRCEDDMECIASGTINIEAEKNYRKKFTALDDGDKFEIQ